MVDHVTIRASDRAASRRFYEALLRTLGIEQTSVDEWDDFSLAQAGGGRPVTRRLHMGFVAPSRAHVDAFWQAGLDAGYRDDGAPGPRPQYRDDYYGAFLLDPDGNSAEAVHHGALRRGGNIDHLWIRVADVAAAARFYDVIAPYANLRRRGDHEERIHFAGESGSFALVRGEPTEGLHLAFPAHDDETVRRFHAAGIEAGYHDGGAPGERPHYHPGYYAAFLLDPDGSVVEVVNHNRGG